MKRNLSYAALALCLWTPERILAQEKAAQEKGGKSTAIPRTADGHPDLSGVWWRGADVGGRPAPGGQPAVAPPAPGAPPPVTFASLYTDAAKAKAKTMLDKDDPTLRCTPTAFGTLNVSMFDVGAVAQIVQTPKFVVFLTET